MSATAILTLFVCFVAAEYLLNLVLELMNIRHVRERADIIPERLHGWISEASYRRSVDYTLARAQFGLVEEACSTGFLLVFVLVGGFELIDRPVVALGFGPKLSGVAYFALLALLFAALAIPFRLYSRFVIEERFGFNRMTLRLWLVDLLKVTLLAVCLGAPVLFGLLWFMEATGAWWWAWASGFVFLVTLFIQMVYPSFIAPWFNRFTPLENEGIRTSVGSLAESVGFKMGGIYQMDASRRSSHGNAYFAGFGSSRRIVLFDTLLRSLSADQIVGVLAHEMGHYKLRHITKNLALGGAIQFLAFYVLSLLLQYEPFYGAFGFDASADYRALAVFFICSGPFTFFLTPIFSAISRHFEYQADQFAVRATGSVGRLSEALLGLSRDNLSNLTPHPWYSFFHYTHPTLLERLNAIEKR